MWNYPTNWWYQIYNFDATWLEQAIWNILCSLVNDPICLCIHLCKIGYNFIHFNIRISVQNLADCIRISAFAFYWKEWRKEKITIFNQLKTTKAGFPLNSSHKSGAWWVATKYLKFLDLKTSFLKLGISEFKFCYPKEIEFCYPKCAQTWTFSKISWFVF